VTQFPSWRDALAPVLSTPQAGSLFDFLQSEEAAGKVIYPPRDQRFAALELTRWMRSRW
jgi:uracil-DNA glycosylase